MAVLKNSFVNHGSESNMSKNVNNVEAGVSTNGNIDEDYTLINKKELAQLQYERDEYRAMCLDFAESVPRFHKVQENIETILANGGAQE
nr:hypothetical protein [uncultured Methanobrevibacter sp.]